MKVNFFKKLAQNEANKQGKEKKRKKGPKKLINLLCYCVFYSIPARKNEVKEEKWNLCKNLKQRVWKSRKSRNCFCFFFACSKTRPSLLQEVEAGQLIICLGHTHKLYLSFDSWPHSWQCDGHWWSNLRPSWKHQLAAHMCVRVPRKANQITVQFSSLDFRLVRWTNWQWERETHTSWLTLTPLLNFALTHLCD